MDVRQFRLLQQPPCPARRWSRRAAPRTGPQGLISSKAAIRPLATSSQRVMPPKMLKSTAFTESLARISSTACLTFSASEPPPASRKLAGCPPAWATTSSVDITSPAPLPRIPICRRALRTGRAALWRGARSDLRSRCRRDPGSQGGGRARCRRVRPSRRAPWTSRSGVTISGLISASVASSLSHTS